ANDPAPAVLTSKQTSGTSIAARHLVSSASKACNRSRASGPYTDAKRSSRDQPKLSDKSKLRARQKPFPCRLWRPRLPPGGCADRFTDGAKDLEGEQAGDDSLKAGGCS